MDGAAGIPGTWPFLPRVILGSLEEPEGSAPMRLGIAELTVVRHGESTANVAFAAAEAAGVAHTGLTGRDMDVPLSDLGRMQAGTFGRALVAKPPAVARPDVVVCSPYLRARQTWRIAAEAAADAGLVLPEPVLDTRLGDRSMGRLELLTTEAIADRFPVEAERRRAAGEFSYRPPGGESFGDVASRLALLLGDLNRRHAGRRVLLVAHDSVVLMLRRVIERLTCDDLAGIVAAGPVKHTAVTRFIDDGGSLVLAEFNTDDHLLRATGSGLG